MRILLPGASGLLGSALARLAAEHGHEVIGIVGRWPAPVPGLSRQVSLDLGGREDLARLFRECAPDWIINTAAIAEPAACDAAPDLAERINVGVPARLATLARETGARFLHVSSEQVFDGETPPYSIASPVRPLHRYGRQKAAAEQLVLATAPAATVVRAPLLFGNSLGGRRSVHEKFLEAWAQGRVMRLFTEEVRRACSAQSVAAALLEIAERRELRGILHWAGADAVSRYAMGRAICAHFGFPETWIEPTPRAAMPDFTATRPRDLTLDLAPLDRVLCVRPERFDDTVAALVLPAWWRGFGAG